MLITLLCHTIVTPIFTYTPVHHQLIIFELNLLINLSSLFRVL